MKKFYYKREIPQEETPILKSLGRSHTLICALENEANTEWHELNTRMKKSNRTSNGSYRENFVSFGSDEATPSFVIKDTDLASSWIYTKRKAAVDSESSEPTSPFTSMTEQDIENDLESSQLEFKRIPIAPSVKSKSFCCCYMTVLLIIFICVLGIISSVGGIVYLEIFTTDRKFVVFKQNSSEVALVDVNTHLDQLDHDVITSTESNISTEQHFPTEHENSASTSTLSTELDGISSEKDLSTELESTTSRNILSTEFKNVTPVNISSKELSEVSVNINAFQARRGKSWDDDYDDEITEITSFATATFDNKKSPTTLVPTELNKFTDAVVDKVHETSLSTDKVVNHLTEPSTLNAYTTFIRHAVKFHPTIQSTSDIAFRETRIPSSISSKTVDSTLQSDTTLVQTATDLQLSTKSKPHSDIRENSENPEFSKNFKPKIASTSNVFQTTDVLPTATDNLSKLPFSNVDSILQETTKMKGDVNFPSTTSFHIQTIEPTVKTKRPNNMGSLQESLLAVLRQLQKLDKQGILPHSRMQDSAHISLQNPKRLSMEKLTQNAAESVLSTLDEKERVRYLDKLRSIYFNVE